MIPAEHRLSLAARFLNRRQFLGRCGMGMGGLALAQLMGGLDMISAQRASAQSQPMSLNPLEVKSPPWPARAKRVIHLFMNGGPSHVDTFDPKPMLEKYAGKPLPTPNLRTERRTGAAMPSPFKFRKYGQSVFEVSELFE
jgi:hypothetical protein